MEAASPAESKRTTTGGREAKPKAAKKVVSKGETALRPRSVAAEAKF
jgi:hypothetical protein